MHPVPPLPSSWAATWISPTEEDRFIADRPAYSLEHAFDLVDGVMHAWLHATALGVYEVFLNGQRVGDEELAPGFTSYDETLHAQSHDVASLLQTGKNTVEIVLSDGWYRGCNGGLQRRNVWGDTTAALAQLDIETVNGSAITLGTDASWTSRISRVVRADLMRGQTTDLSRPRDAARPVRVGVVAPPQPTRSPAPPVRRVELLPVATTTLRPGVTIVDVGQNISGWVRLDDLGPAGSITTLTHGEHLDAHGDVTTEHLAQRSPQGEQVDCHQVDEVVAGREVAVFEPRHTVHGFRYVRIEHPGRALRADAVTAVVAHSDMRRTGWFECDDERLNRLHEAAVWSFRGNAVDVPTDCPTRERSGWTGDYQVFAPTAARMYDIDGFSRKWLQSVRDDQYENGSLAMFSPDSERMKTDPSNPQRIGGGSAGWGDAIVAVPWTLYQHSGDDKVLRENWTAMQAWAEFALRSARTHRHPTREARSETPAPHEDYVWDGPFHFGEWCEATPISPAGTDLADAYQALLSADQGDVGTAFLYRTTKQLAEIAATLGCSDDAARYREVAGLARSAWVEEFLTADGRTTRDSQASYVRALDFGLVPDDLVPAAAARLVELIEQNVNHLTTGFLTTGTLLEVLADTGHLDVAYGLLTRTGVPSWLEMLERGATTYWENWDAVSEDGAVSPGSLNHYAKGAAMRFLHTHVAGLRQAPGSVGWREIVVEPRPGGEVTRAAARLETPRGLVEVAWSLANDAITLTATLPEGVHGTAHLPDTADRPLSPGTTTLTSPWPPTNDRNRP